MRRRNMYFLGGGGLGALNYPSIDAAITKFEGSGTPGSIGAQNNNPGNLVYAPWESKYGCTPGGAGGFAQCPTPEAGQQIQDALVTTYVDQGLSITDLISKWSPPTAAGNSQASTSNYISSVAADTGMDPTTSIAAQLSAAAPADGQTAASADVLGDDYGAGPNWTMIAAAAGAAVLLLLALGR